MKRRQIADIEQSSSLIFGDSAEFMKLYFEGVSRFQQFPLCVYQYSREQLISHLLVQYMLLNWGGNICQVGYISYGGTSPEYRGKSFYARLLKAAHMQMRQRGALFSFLIPAGEGLYSYYKNVAQYVEAAKARTVIKSSSSKSDGRSVQLNDAFTAAQRRSLYCNEQRKRERLSPQPYLVHTYDWWQAAVKNVEMFGGFAEAWPNDAYSVRLWERSEKFPNMLKAAVLPDEQPANSNEKLSSCYLHGMVRLLNIPRIVALYAHLHPTEELRFALWDDEIKGNSGNYRVQKGNLLFSSFSSAEERLIQKKAVTSNSHSNCPLYTPVQLTHLLFANTPFLLDGLLDVVEEDCFE